MNVIFNNASNGEESCSFNNVRLHSSYNPSKEAARFAETAECSFNPSFVLVTEPALSYCAEPLKNRFKDAKICCVRFCHNFMESDSKWDKVFLAVSDSDENQLNNALSEEIFNYMGDEGTASCLFLSWKPSEQAFASTHLHTWEEIKKAVMKSRSVLATRNYFAKRWTKNALRFSMFTDKTAYIQKGKSDVVVCASGPSLWSSIENLKKYRERYFLIAVSSALKPLIHNEIIPDLCISTDGGYWAKLHISFALEEYNIPLALPGEGSCFGSILNKTNVIPLYYGDGTSESILKGSKYNGMTAVRNGSVSGTAAYLAMSITEGNIYYCGLDLNFSSGHVHTQPNELEINDSRFDCRLRTTETRVNSKVLNRNSIDIYRAWFASTNFRGRIFRLSDNFKYGNELGRIQDVDWNYFEENTEEFKSKVKPQVIRNKLNSKTADRLGTLKEICKANMNNSEWIHNAVPSEAVVMDRNKGTDSYEASRKIVMDGMASFMKDITRAIER
ncbi:MAG: DUF115 domain-containing protein [Treponema sp.]|nr:DUF115 domain-containing protein [Candidatus Treponema equi]